MRIQSLFFGLFCLMASLLHAQNEAIEQERPSLNFSGFLDVFYVYDFNQPEGTERQDFLFNHNRHNAFNLNLGLVRVDVDHSKYRASLALQTGTYAIDNYAAEPGFLQNIFEANVGISLDKANKLWLDAGVLPSHIGFESALSSENFTLTRSILAENSPYFLTGAQLTYTPNEKWEFAGLVVNGWQRIQRLEGNSLLSFGTQVNYKASESATLNWSTFIGTDDPDEIRRMRYFNNIYGQFQLSNKFDLIAGCDVGLQQKAKGSSSYHLWLTPVLIGQYTVNSHWKTALRAEYYQDEMGVMISTETGNGFQTTGFSLNLDYSPSSNLICRIEGRWLNSKDAIFARNSALSRHNFIIATSIAIHFAEGAL